jgi:hypothetical protein
MSLSIGSVPSHHKANHALDVHPITRYRAITHISTSVRDRHFGVRLRRGYMRSVIALVAIWVWGWWLLAIKRSGVWSWAMQWYWAEPGTRSHRFWMDWGFLVLAPFVAAIGIWPSLWPRLVSVTAITGAVTLWRLRSEDTWRLYEPPLRSPDIEP